MIFAFFIVSAYCLLNHYFNYHINMINMMKSIWWISWPPDQIVQVSQQFMPEQSKIRKIYKKQSSYIHKIWIYMMQQLTLRNKIIIFFTQRLQMNQGTSYTDNHCSQQLTKYLDPKTDEKIVSLPLQFEYLPVEILSKQFTKLNSSHAYRIHYLGPRFTDTQVLHKKYSGQNSKTSTYFEELYNYQKYEVEMRKIIQSNYLNQKLQDNRYYRSAIFYRAFEGMNPTLNHSEQLRFNSCFEAGNLDCVIKVNPSEFDLFLRIDSNTRGHTQWFYFSIRNGKKLGKFTFNLCNLTKPHTLYEQQNNIGSVGSSGMRPYIFSKQKSQKYNQTWEQGGSNVSVVEKPFRYDLVYQMIDPSVVYRLSFDYEFEEEDDEVYFAYSIPYTYSQMLGDLDRLEYQSQHVKRSILGRSLTGVDIPVLHITNHLNIGSKKKNILITGRIHPGESNGSHVLKGFMQFLCSNNEDAKKLRNRINFYIIPMVNPDGVIMGNSRTSASGKDLNRQYLSSKRQLYPEVVLIKNLAYKLHRQEGVFIFFDFHGHSRKKNTFFYGPGYSLADIEYYKSRALAKLIQKCNPNFRYYSCSFMISEDKKRTARAVLFQQYKIPYVFTIQSSIGLYYDSQLFKTMEFTEKQWKKTGESICQGLNDFIVAHEQYQALMKQRRVQRQKKKEKLKKNVAGNQRKAFEEDLVIQQNQKKPNVMMDLFEDVKNTSQAKNSNINNEECSSDDHDEAEDLQSSKLAEFNTLVIQTKQKIKNSQQKGLGRINENQDEFDPIIFNKSKRNDSENDEMQMFKEIQEQRNSKKMMPNNKISVPKRQSKSSTKIITKPPFVHSNIKSRVHYSSKPIASTKNNGEQKLMDLKKQPKKNEKIEKAHRHLISKQFFPIEKCEIVDLPNQVSPAKRKQIRKGRVIMEDYLNDKRKDKQLLVISKPNDNQQFKESSTKLKNRTSSVKISDSPQRQKLRSDTSNKNKGAGFRSMNFDRIASNNIHLKRNYTVEGRRNNSRSNTPQNTQLRIFDSTLFTGFQGFQVDNMAMMIRTFNKG